MAFPDGHQLSCLYKEAPIKTYAHKNLSSIRTFRWLPTPSRRANARNRRNVRQSFPKRPDVAPSIYESPCLLRARRISEHTPARLAHSGTLLTREPFVVIIVSNFLFASSTHSPKRATNQLRLVSRSSN